MGKKKSKKNRQVKAASRKNPKKAAHRKNYQKLPRISACMIVKNEEELLPQCLQSIDKYVDEIIVVDTGSTDETVAIAESFGAKIYHHPWEDDFSKHRNQSLSYATGDWVLVLDADEEMVAGTGPILRDTIMKNAADYYFCPFYDINRHGEVTAVYNSVRLFRNNMQMTYTRRIHNQLELKGKGVFSKIRFKHFGYDLTSEKMEAKHVRTTALLKKAIAEDPEDGYSYHQLAISYLVRKEYAKGLEYGEKALDIRRHKNQKNIFDINTFYLVAGAYFKSNDIESAHRIGLEANSVFGDHLDICYILTAVYFKQNSIEKCKQMARRYLAIFNQLEEDPSIIGGGICYSFSVYKRSTILTYLAYASFIEKDFQSAESYFQQAFENACKQIQMAENIYRFYQKQRRGNQALQWLVTVHETGCTRDDTPKVIKEQPSLYLKIAEHYLQHDDPEAAFQCLGLAQDMQLTLDQQMEKKLLQINALWVQNAIEELVKTMESLMMLLHMDTNRRLDSFDDLGGLFYEAAEVLTEQQKWRLAETTLKLAYQMAPHCFQADRFQPLLTDSIPLNHM